MIALPEDILYLICLELAERNDFGTLFNSALTGKHLAGPAITSLYRAYHRSTVKDEASEIALAQQSVIMAKWSIMWRSIILSCFEKTLYPYHRYIRVLDLRDLENLLEDEKFVLKISAIFFEGDLEQFNITRAPLSRPKRNLPRRPIYDIKAILGAVGDVITDNSPALEELTGDLTLSWLRTWIPRIPKLKSLDLKNGNPLEDESLRALIHASCRGLNSIRLYQWSPWSDETDEQFAAFLSGMTPQTLQSLETIGDVRLGAISFLALANHSSSLTSLKLQLVQETIPHLALLQGCTALKTLQLNDSSKRIDLEALDDEEFKQISKWLSECKKLNCLVFTDFGQRASTLATPFLLSNHDQLEELQIDFYPSEDPNIPDPNTREFLLALTHQSLSLTALSLRGESPRLRDDLDALAESLSQLPKLRQLQIREVSETFRDEHIFLLAESLTELEELVISGSGPSDLTLSSFCALRKLRSLTLSGISTCTASGILSFVENLGPNNAGLILTIDMADGDHAIAFEEVTKIQRTLEASIGGRFEYTLWRGLEADQKVIAAHGCYAMTATTALTAQNTQGVYGIHETPPDFVKKQIDACINDVGVDVVKTGMLGSEATIRVIADALREYKVPLSVVDPVMVATTGAHLLPGNAVNTLIEHLLPVTTILTPNLPEAQTLLKCAGKKHDTPKNIDDIVEMAKTLQSLGPKYVLLKGGHLPLTKDRLVSEDQAEHHIVYNFLYGEGQAVSFESEYIESKNTHGTGCSLASAIASNLASGMTMVQAVKFANQYVEAGIRTSQDIGKGSGPINHFHSTYHLPFAPGRFIEYLLDREDVKEPWKRHTEHDFVKGLANGSLPVERFEYYLIQDYLFLLQFGRANALSAYKAKTWTDITKSVANVMHLREETKLHVEYCKGFGLSEDEMKSYEEHQACTAYTRYILDIGQSEDWFALQVALLPCLIGYGMIAQRLYNDPATLREGNKYWQWIETYVAEDYNDAMRIGRELVEKHAVNQSVSRIDELAKIFIHATKMETGFWDMGCSD